MKVEIKPIGKNAWSNIDRFMDAVFYIGPFFSKRAGRTYPGGLNEQQRIDLEDKLGYAKGTLAATNEKFWDSYTALKITGSKPVILDTDNPEDELKYLYCKDHVFIKNGANDRKPMAKFIMINPEEEAKAKNVKNQIRINAISEFSKMSIDDMRKYLRICGIKPEGLSNEVIQAKVYEKVENESKSFLDKWTNNSNREVESLINEAVSKNVIRKNKTTYYYGTDVIGNGLTDAVAWMKDKKNSDIRLSIMDEISVK